MLPTRATGPLKAVRERVEALRPMAVGSLSTVLAVDLLSNRPTPALHAVEHVLLAYFLAELALAAAAGPFGPVRWLEAAVLVPYAALVSLHALPVPATLHVAGVRAVLCDLHCGLAVARELVALDAVASAGLAGALEGDGNGD